MPTPFDHVLAALLLVVWPLWMVRNGASDLRAMKDPAQRRQAYLVTLAVQWAHTALILGLWAWTGRAWTSLGLGLPLGWGLGAVASTSVLVVVGLQVQLGRVRRQPRLRAKVREQMAELVELFPTNAVDTRLARGVALTAGVCEELAYRGFLLWYLDAWFSLWVAVPLAAGAFGAAHLYQAPRQAAQVALTGLVAALLYLAAGSLWLPMALHAFLDLNMLEVARVARVTEEDDGSSGAGELPLQPEA